ncbi:MAG: cysteine peptidase family C39 domain-containing protein [Gemmataceae bacterium]|nr:cysteine peptidase family C39 domain-containing protein [Gemmataceae bacterium]
MSIELPLYGQEKDNTCALACLRMVLAAYGTDVDESTLLGQARMEQDGTEIGELERFARQFGIVADLQEATVDQLRELLAEGRLPIAYIDRAVFELTPRQRAKHTLRHAKVHVVIPTRISAAAVNYHDPLAPPRIVRKSMRLFRLAYDRLGSRCVVCSKPEGPFPG